MRKKILIIILVLIYSSGFGQKPVLDTTAFNGWPYVNCPLISNDGKFVSYRIENQPVNGGTLVIQKLFDKWRKNIIGGKLEFFSSDSQKGIFTIKDSLFVLEFSDNSLKFKGIVDSFKYPEINNNDWIAYQIKGRNDSLMLYNIYTNEVKTYGSVINYGFDRNGQFLLIETKAKDEQINDYSLRYISLKSKNTSTIWTSKYGKPESIKSFAFNDDGTQIAFIVGHADNDLNNNSIWIYKNDRDEAEAVVTVTNLEPNFVIGSDGLKFNSQSDKIFFNLSRIANHDLKKTGSASVDIWNYKDELLQSEQVGRRSKDQFRAVVNLNTKMLVRLEDEYSSLSFSSNNNSPKGNYLIAEKINYFSDYWWHKDFAQNIELVSTLDGARRPVLNNSKHIIRNVKLSPSEEFVVWYDPNAHHYYSYEIASGKIRNLSKDLPYPLFDNEKSSPNKQAAFGLVGWVEDGKSILVYDRYDIWDLNLLNGRKPINTTNKFGRNNRIVLGVADNNIVRNFKENDTVLIAGFNRNTKENGFFKTVIGKGGITRKGKMQSYSFCIPRTVPYVKGLGTIRDLISAGWPIKAKNTDLFLVYRMKSDESINLFTTKDLVNFKRISDIHPETKYNWITAELHHWKMLDGKPSQGILYKPENFSEKKKYPLIFLYYEEKSDGLHMFMQPRYSSAIIDIPYYVSNGYLVFVPDIHFKKGHIGKGTVNSVVSAAAYLSKYEWVDSNRLGIHGQSFGGYETNYLITHSNIFKAACEGSGSSNLISSYSQLTGGLQKGSGGSRQSLFEIDQSFIGVTPWERPDLYVENSPVFGIQNVTTPLLIWHCKDDVSVPFEQGIEMFLGMRRANKKVWLLQYDGDGHAVGGNNAIDLTTRMKQFFDHYLKNTPAPVWMTRGIPYKDKQVQDGLELDYSGVQP
ncbi:hypothetical protein CPT03_01735 [Pedobacter ginsengisoli]|uniref:Peptidase S9 prolyl oligopeptidase catalytic domain-containing protein n=1 Tax=Pedobacter ginsengisoli TaxID=363852 RepID=A0A2D1U0Y8_9SPHI|nr:prolyl oligopeptidase family serine peptidase [Pedobacter ginsengisoli]ATP55273.1 hypothetical protein CPT03_01735 [Pedobacter ginsengisoli]